jgi:hypothetical protein
MSFREEDFFPETVELPSYRLKGGSIIRIGDTVELKDRTDRKETVHALSGDFLKISSIVENLQTQEIKLNGYRLRRCSYLCPLFDGTWSCRDYGMLHNEVLLRCILTWNRKAQRIVFTS